MPKAKTDFLQGTLDMLILQSLASGPQHGYRIAQRIQQCSDDVLKVEEGSLYPSLYRMEQKGWIKSEWGMSDNNREAKFYKLTPRGWKELESETDTWKKLSSAVSKAMRALEA
jgi:PadR family transcriptional regulator, regulatory protein PadR